VVIGLLPRLWVAAREPCHTLADEAAWWGSSLPDECQQPRRPFERRLLGAGPEHHEVARWLLAA
jgi:hypothetical protein